MFTEEKFGNNKRVFFLRKYVTHITDLLEKTCVGFSKIQTLYTSYKTNTFM